MRHRPKVPRHGKRPKRTNSRTVNPALVGNFCGKKATALARVLLGSDESD
ncbi:Uncharacterised protein [Vibrio cholerae]|nr:Uncharacterised protein [Vibrio cholerae]